MIVRIWHGETPAELADEYAGFVAETGIKRYRSTEGNRGVLFLRRFKDGVAEFLLLSLWDSIASIQNLTGPEVDKAVYFPDDEKYLHEMEADVTHFELLWGPERADPPEQVK